MSSARYARFATRSRARALDVGCGGPVRWPVAHRTGGRGYPTPVVEERRVSCDDAVVSVRAKLLLAIVPLVLAIVAIGGLTVVTAVRLGDNPEAILRQNYQSVLAVQQMREALEQLDAAASLAVAGRTDLLQPEAAYRQRFADALLLQEASVFEHAERPPTEKIREEWPWYERAFTTFVRLAPDLQAAARFYAEQLSPRFEQLKGILDELLTVNQRAMFEKSTWARETAQRAIRDVIVAAMVALAVALPISVVLVRRVLRRLERVTNAAERLGGGDFEARAVVGGRDEIAALGRTFDAMATRLSEYRASSLGKLLEAQRTSQAAIDSIPDPILVFDAAGALVGQNGAATSLFRRSAAGGVDAHEAALEQLPQAVRLAVVRARDHVLQAGVPHVPGSIDEAVPFSSEAGEQYLLARGTPVERPDVRAAGATVVLQEVTRLRRLDELRNDLVATVAHELRTPLTSLRMAILLCLEQADAVANIPTGLKLLQTARDDCERLQATVDELLDLARIQSGEVVLHRGRVAAGRLIGDAVAQANPRAREHGVTLVVPTVGEGLQVVADAERLQLVFTNLLVNAIRHSPAGGTVVLGAEAVEGVVRFEVADQGEGIGPEHVAHVFDRFYRVPGAPPGGVGLGLAIARELVVAHGGEIGVDSRPHAGSRFWFTVPRVAPRIAQNP